MNLPRRLTVGPESAGERLDRWLAAQDFIPSRARAAQLLKLGLVCTNGIALKASQKLVVGQIVEVDLPPPAPSKLIPLAGPLDIVYEDSDLAVINKPSGLVVHPAAGHAQDTLVNLLLHNLDRLSLGFNEQRPGIVHRLDRDTSGLMVVAKNDSAHFALAEQFRFKTARRAYWALVGRRLNPAAATIRTRLMRDPHDRKRYASTTRTDGKLAITHYKTLLVYPSGVTWLECRLETGRTHQIRVHLREAGSAIVADPLYGPNRKRTADLAAPRLALHAFELGFRHPRDGRDLLFVREWPDDLANYVAKLGTES